MMWKGMNQRLYASRRWSGLKFAIGLEQAEKHDESRSRFLGVQEAYIVNNRGPLRNLISILQFQKAIG